MRSRFRISILLLLLTTFASADTIQTDLLIVGGTESGWAAAIQAARMSARGLIPAARDKVEFQPDAPAAKEWQKALLRRCGRDMPVDEKLTRGQFADRIWQKLERCPPSLGSAKSPMTPMRMAFPI